MPRRRRFAPAGETFHIVNRGVERRQLFFDDSDYVTFLSLLQEGKSHASVKVFGFCTMPNHFHALLRPEEPGALSEYVHWVSTCFAGTFRARTESRGLGHVFQQRFWSNGIDGVDHYYAALRYIEANAHRACLVDRAEDWRWGSLYARVHGNDSLLDDSPYELPDDWTTLVNLPQFDRDRAIAAFRPKRGRPCTIL